METPHPTSSQNFGKVPIDEWRESLAAAARFWEPRRLVYNLILTAVVAAWIVVSWPHFRPALTLESLGILSVLALLANVCYCAAYLADFGMQSARRETSEGAERGAVLKRWRWGLWAAGTLAAVVFENYWIADEIYPYVR